MDNKDINKTVNELMKMGEDTLININERIIDNMIQGIDKYMNDKFYDEFIDRITFQLQDTQYHIDGDNIIIQYTETIFNINDGYYPFYISRKKKLFILECLQNHIMKIIKKKSLYDDMNKIVKELGGTIDIFKFQIAEDNPLDFIFIDFKLKITLKEGKLYNKIMEIYNK